MQATVTAYADDTNATNDTAVATLTVTADGGGGGGGGGCTATTGPTPFDPTLLLLAALGLGGAALRRVARR